MLALTFEIQIGERQLLHFAEAGCPAARLPRGLDCRQQETNQNTDDGNDDQELHEREAAQLTAVYIHERNSPKDGRKIP